ncbi:uncharacterized protein [Symphalangus syndactylus]|uniref:uncharacterized protein n=1 Tax=Symphalangus syndactylus TaxID=9590 RepID=UPI003007BB63
MKDSSVDLLTEENNTNYKPWPSVVVKATDVRCQMSAPGFLPYRRGIFDRLDRDALPRDEESREAAWEERISEIEYQLNEIK